MWITSAVSLYLSMLVGGIVFGWLLVGGLSVLCGATHLVANFIKWCRGDYYNDYINNNRS